MTAVETAVFPSPLAWREQPASVGFESDDHRTPQPDMTLYYQGLTPFVYLEDLAGSGNIGAESADLHGESAWKITSVSGSARAGVARLQEMVARPEDVVVIEVPSDFVVPANPPVLDLDTRWRRHWLFERRFLVVGVHRQGPMLRTGLLRLRQQVEDDPSLPAHHPWPRARARVALPPGDHDIGAPRDRGRECPPCGAGTPASECHEILRWVRRRAKEASPMASGVGWSPPPFVRSSRPSRIWTRDATHEGQLNRATRWRDGRLLAWAGER